MRKLVLLAALTTAMLGSLAGRAEAQAIGPICLKANPFNNVFVMIYNFHTPNSNHLLGTGRDLTTGGTVSSTIFLTGGTAVVGMAFPAPPTGSDHSVFISANLSLGSLTGPGRCEAVNTQGGGCSTGYAINMAVVSCPAGAFDESLALDVLPSGPRLGGGQEQ